MMSRRSTISRRATPLALIGIIALGACKETAAPGGEFTIDPTAAEILVGGNVQLTAFNAPSTPTWSSSASQVATVIAETGYVVGVGRGTATISAVAEGAVASIEVTVLQPPAITLSTPTVDFFMDVGGANPASQTVQVGNSGDVALTGLSVQGITYGPNNPRNWLTVTPSGDAAPATLTLAANGLGLPRGVYTATVQIASTTAANSPQSIGVMLHVQKDAEIAVSRTTVPMAGIPGVTINETVDLTNAGDKTLDGLAVEVRYPPNMPANWLTATLDGTIAPTTIRLAATTQSLPVGSYTTVVRVTSGIAGVAPVDITVNLTVSPGPAITLSSTVVNLQANTGQNPANQMVQVTNGGGGSLTGLGIGAITYEAGQPTGWLTATLSGTTAPASITLTTASATLPEGFYTATVPVQSPVASNSPLALTVNLNVGPPPVISLSLEFVAFTGWLNGALPGILGTQVTNAAVGAGPLPGLSYTVTYGPGASDWLNLEWQGNKTDAPTTLLMQPNTSSLPEGNYSVRITISTTVPGVAPDTVDVMYEMRSFSADIHPRLGGCLGGGCHGGGQPPHIGGSAQNDCAALQSYLIPGDGANSYIYRKLTGQIGHSGGTSSLATRLRQWIDSNAVCS